MGEQIGYVTNELENAIDYLEQATRFYEDKDNPHRFKWLMITLHGALYGFGVCAIKGTRSYANVIKDIKVNPSYKRKYKKKKEELETLLSEHDFDIDAMTKLNISELQSIWSILNKCKSEKYMTQFEDSKILQINPTQEYAINELFKYRNDLAHFKPSFYGVTGNFDKDIVHPVIEVINFLALHSNNIMYFNDESKSRVERSISRFLGNY